MRWTLVMLAALAFVPMLASGAECRPDLSGEWSREVAAAAGAEDAYRAEGSGWSDRIRVSQDAGRVTIESFYFSKGDLQPPLRFTYLPGQGATGNVVMVGRGIQRQESTAQWSECRLVISTQFPGNDAAMSHVTQTLWLEPDASLVVEAARGDARPNRTIYRRVAVAGGR